MNLTFFIFELYMDDARITAAEKSLAVKAGCAVEAVGESSLLDASMLVPT